jgi:hypothetical protein
MFTHPDLIYVLAKQHASDLTASAERARLLRSARQYRRSTAAARKAAAAEPGATSRAGRRGVSEVHGSLTACDPRVA